jgi:4-amino-4-deoxy-L-arabinose transferase-like glycosyltransferase
MKTYRQGILDSLIVFGTALLLRTVYLYQIADTPTFDIPIVDSWSYHKLALALSHGHDGGKTLFWQPLFYPLWLSLLYRAAGPCLWCARALQAVFAAGSCVLVYWTGRKALSRREGLMAALVMACYGPLIFFDIELLGEVWAVWWICTLLLLFTVAPECDHPLLYPLIGICGALAILTRPPLLIFFAAGCLVFVSALLRRMPPGQAGIRLGLALVGFFCLTLPVARWNANQTGHFGILPSSAGINLYLGNNPDWKQTVSARPGFEWQAIRRMPYRQGIRDPWEASDYFKGRVWTYVTEHPAAFIRGLAEKAMRFVNSRELPRNVDMYIFRKWSWLLRILVWRIGPFGFPFGLLLPLALIGLCCAWRRIPLSVWLLLILYSPVIILYFVSARYRILIIPGLALAAAAGIEEMIRTLKGRHSRKAVRLWTAIPAMAVLFSFPTSFAEEQIHYEAELYRAIGYQLSEEQRTYQSVPWLRRALAIQPDLLNALNDLSIILTETGHSREALPHAQNAVNRSPENAGLHYNLGLIYLDLENNLQAEAAFRRALTLDAGLFHAYINLGICLNRQQRYEEAAARFRQALRLRPAHPQARQLLDQTATMMQNPASAAGM